MSLARIKRHSNSVSVIIGQKWDDLKGQQRTDEGSCDLDSIYLLYIYSNIVANDKKKNYVLPCKNFFKVSEIK